MVSKTFSPKPTQVASTWHVIDAQGRVLGRLASEIAHILMGKHKPIYARHINTGDFVIVTNAAKVHVTGNKRQSKIYYRHTGYMGHLRETPLWKMLEEHPERVIQQAVKGMLPKNSLGDQMLKRLKVYPGPDHPHEAQVKGGERATRTTPARPTTRQERRERRRRRAQALKRAATPAQPEPQQPAATEEETPSEAQVQEQPAQEEPSVQPEAQPEAEAQAQRVEAEEQRPEATTAEEEPQAEEPPAEAEEQRPQAADQEQPQDRQEPPASSEEEKGEG